MEINYQQKITFTINEDFRYETLFNWQKITEVGLELK